jgi:hypothetical protein
MFNCHLSKQSGGIFFSYYRGGSVVIERTVGQATHSQLAQPSKTLIGKWGRAHLAD